MRYIGDSDVSECAMMTVQIITEAGPWEVKAVAVVNHWAATEATGEKGGYNVTYLPYGAKLNRNPLAASTAARIVGKLRDIRLGDSVEEFRAACRDAVKGERCKFNLGGEEARLTYTQKLNEV